MRYLLGVDFGGGASKATLINEKGEKVCSVSGEYAMYYPHPGWAEQDPEEIYRVFVQNVRAVLEKSGVRPGDVAALALDGGTHIAVLLDSRARVIRPAIYWSDTRSAKQAAALSEHRDRIVSLTYNPPSPIWTLPQLMWLREEEPESFARIDRVLFLKDYIRFRLTGELGTDSIEAMGSMLLDATALRWDPLLCSLCGLSTDVMPPIYDPADIVGKPTAGACGETGLSPDTLVCTGATDTVMEVFAAGAIGIGQSTLKLATAGRICVVTDKAVPSPMLVGYRHIIPGLWYPGTATKTCAAALRWYRDALCEAERDRERAGAGDAYKLIDEAAERVPPGSDGLLFHPYLQGEITPYPSSALRASFTNVSSMHGKAHFDRAVMEGVAYSMRDCMEVIGGLGLRITDAVRLIGGGGKSPLWGQIVSDVLGMPLLRSLTDDSSIGSAMLAGVASGVFGSYEESVALCSRTGARIYPREENAAVYNEGFAAYKEIQRALIPAYERLNG